MAGAAVEDLMKADPPLTQEAWHRLQGWYKATVDRPPPPARATLKGVTAERAKLYSRVLPPGDTIPVTIEPFEVEDGVPLEAEVEWAVKRLQNNRAGGASRMRAEDFKGWMAAARRGEKEREAKTKEGGDRGENRRLKRRRRDTGGGSWRSYRRRFGMGNWRRKSHGRRWSSSRKGRGTTGASA